MSRSRRRIKTPRDAHCGICYSWDMQDEAIHKGKILKMRKQLADREDREHRQAYADEKADTSPK